MLTPATSDPANWDGTYIHFRMCSPDPNKKTETWNVYSKEWTVIGVVKWFGRWRKYTFFPTSDTVFEETCLQEIAQFIKERTTEHRTGI